MYFFSKAVPTFQGRWVFLAGISVGVASLFKPIGLSPLLAQGAFMLLLWAVFRRLSLRHLSASVLTSSSGVLVGWLPVGIYFWRHDALGDLVHASFIYNIQYGRASWGSALAVLFNAASELYVLTTLVVSVAVLLVLYVRRCAASPCTPELEDNVRLAAWFWCPLVLLWVFADVSGALAGGRNYSQYFLALAPSLSVAAGFTYWFLIDRIPYETRCSARNAIFAVIVGPLILAQVWDMRVFRKAHPLQPWQEVATQLNAIRTLNDSLFTWDYLPGIYLMTEMKSPTHQLDAHYIFDSAESHRYGEEILRDLRRALPTFIVDATTKMVKQSRTSADILAASDPVYRNFRQFLEDQYTLIYTHENLRVYRNRVHS